MKLTPWFPGDVKPVHVGVYKRKWRGNFHFSYWDGERFGKPSFSPAGAYFYRVRPSIEQSIPWRGIAK